MENILDNTTAEKTNTDAKNLRKIAEELGIKLWQAEAVTGLIDSGNTIPFIARYRKEATGAMDDEALRTFDERLKYLRNLDERRQTIISTIEEQGKLTEELRAKIEAAETAAVLEDLYRPYKQKKKTNMTLFMQISFLLIMERGFIFLKGLQTISK